ncbi:MAG: leucine-rich repeat protein [Clostridia bacterium]|nr:leucine-rich repeat protein [Clostridia bacterium]
MQGTKRRWLWVGILVTAFVACLGAGLFANSKSNRVDVLAETADSSNGFVVSGISSNVSAEFEYVRLNDNECSVRLANKASATKAIIPEDAIIDGKKYAVTQVATSSFSSAPFLVRVRIPNSVKKIGNSAFNNCPELARIVLGNVEEIGNTAFYKCPKLEELFIPQSVKKVGSYILRNNNTQVRVRAEAAGPDWAMNWNANNANQNVEYNTAVNEKLELEPIFANARSTSIVGYSVAEGQPRVDEYYGVGESNGDTPTNVERKGDNIFIPAMYNGLKIMEISMFAFSDCVFEQVIVEHDSEAILVDAQAFEGAKGKTVTFCRSIQYVENAESVFASSMLSAIVLPSDISRIVPSMFADCKDLSNIYFQTPRAYLSDIEYLEVIENCKNETPLGKVDLPDVKSFDTIGDSAFTQTVSISELHIHNNVKNVGPSIIDNWSNTQTVIVDYFEFEVPQGWHEDWKNESFTNVKYLPSIFVITLNSNGGQVDFVKLEVHYKSAITGLPIPTKNEADFLGWFTKDDEQFSNGDIYTQTQDIELIAKWRYSAKFNSKGGTTCDIKNGKTGDTIKLPSSFLGGHSGYWRDNITGKNYVFGAEYTFASDSVKFTAIWNELPLSNCYNSNSNRYEIWTVNQLAELKRFDTTSRTFELMHDFYVEGTWDGISEFNGILLGNNHTITYQNLSVPYGQNYGFINANRGQVRSIRFKPTISVLDRPADSETIFTGVGGAVGINYGTLDGVYIEKTVQNPYMYSSGNCNVDLYAYNVHTVDLGGVCGNNYGTIINCYNYASLGGGSPMGGIAAASYQNTSIRNSENNGKIFYNFSNHSTVCIGGIVGSAWDNSSIESCTNWASIIWAAKLNNNTFTQPMIARLAGQVNVTVNDINNNAYGEVIVTDEVRASLGNTQLQKVKDEKYADVYNPNGGSSGSCIAEGTLITLADGRQVPVEQLKGNELLRVWNLHTGTFDVAPILFIDSDPAQVYEVINLYFSDGTSVKVITEHGFWDVTLNQYVYLDKEASQYIGHWFNQQKVDENNQLSWTTVQLVKVEACEGFTSAWSPVTYSHLCYYVNGMLSMPGGINGLFNIFEVESETMRYDVAAMENDIEQYGLFTYEEFAQMLPVPQEVFDAFNAQYFKVAIGKGLVTEERLTQLVERYAEQLGIN